MGDMPMSQIHSANSGFSFKYVTQHFWKLSPVFRVKQSSCGCHMKCGKLDKLLYFFESEFLPLYKYNVKPKLSTAMVNGGQHSCHLAIDTKGCNFLYNCYNKITLSLSNFYFFSSYLPSLAWKSEINVQDQLPASFCYKLYDLGNITLPL